MNKGAYHLPISAVLRQAKVDFATGLSSKEVQSRADKYGSNELKKQAKTSLLQRIWQELTNPLVLILVLALGLTLYLGHVVDSIVVALAIVVNISIALYQEGKAKDIFASLEKQQAIRARVRRNGDNQVIPATDLVPGDIVFVSSGELVPADIRILDSDDAEADEAVLTGEWEPVSKDHHPVAKNTNLADRTSMLYGGTLLSGGSVVGLVVSTGQDTEFGSLAAETDAESELTPLQLQLQKLAYAISAIVLALSVLIIIIGLVRDVALEEVLLIAIAIAVSAVPEGLPSAITAILAVGMRHVLQKDGLVKSLLAAETLGTTDVIITDKTGTLTEGRMTAVSLIPAFAEVAPGADDITNLDQHEELLLRSALLCSDGYVTVNKAGEKKANGRPVERALVELGLRLGFDRDELNNDDEEIDFLPFASERRYAAVLVEGQHGHYAILSGAPEYMVSAANFYYDGDGQPSVMRSTDRGRLGTIQRQLASRGHRLTGVARIPIKEHHFNKLDSVDILHEFGNQLEFVGFIGFTDPVRGDVPEAIRLAQEAGARVIVATGDNPTTAQAIASQAKVDFSGRVVEGRELNELSDDEVYDLFQEVSVYARMRPTQKKRLADILQRHHHIVAMTGDGINDAPALASADVGIAVHSGTDVAKSAADLILLQNSFATIVAAIKEGRRLLDNIRRVAVHRISAGFGEILIVISALALAAPVPILPKQILWINIIQGGLLTFAYAFEPADKNVMKRPPNQPGKRGILNDQTKLLLFLSSFAFGLVSLTVYLLSYFGYLSIPLDQLQTLIFAILTIDVMVFSFALKDFNQPIWRINLLSNPVLIVGVSFSFVLFMISMLVPPVRDFLSLSPISPTIWLLVFGVACIDLVLVETAKYISRHVS